MQEQFIVFLIEAITLSIYILYLVWSYAAKEVPFYIKVLTYISWILTFSIAIILPIDIIQQMELRKQQSEQNSLDQSDLQSNLFLTWRILYWSNFLLSWLILPFFQDYEDSGDFFWKDKMKYSIKKNLLIYIIGSILGIVIIILLFLKNDSQEVVQNALIGMANFFGLLLVVLLLGFGLVAIPKRYLHESKEDEVIERCYKDAVLLEEQRTEKQLDMEEICKNILLVKEKYVATEFENYINIIIKQIPLPIRETISKQKQYMKQNKELPKQYNKIDMKFLGVLNKQVKQLVFDLKRIETKFEILVQKMASLDRSYCFEPEVQLNIFQRIIFKIKQFWVNNLRRYYNKYIAYIFSFLSITLMIGEFQVLFKAQYGFAIFQAFLMLIDSSFLINMLLLIFLTYMMFCVYYGLFQMKISGLISFNKRHNTDAPSLMFGSINFGRVSFPLCFNFLQMVTTLDSSNQFIKLFKKMDEYSIFDPIFSLLLPILLIFMSLCNLLNIRDKFMRAVGLGQFAFQESPEVLSSLGKEIIQKERSKRKNQTFNNEETNTEQSLLELPQIASTNYSKKTESVKTNTIRNFDEILNI